MSEQPDRETAGQRFDDGDRVSLGKGLNSEGQRGFILSGEIGPPDDMPVGEGPIVSGPSAPASEPPASE